MTEQPTAGKNDKRYTGDQIDVTYNVRRCIHFAACVRQLPAVFDRSGRPWVKANNAPADQIAEVVMMCPSGALHFERKDGSMSEAARPENTIRVWEDGPLEFVGDLSIIKADTEVRAETRATLCRCGESTNKPFCDNSHIKTGFQSEDTEQRPIEASELAGGKLTVTVEANGPYDVQGRVQIFNHAGALLYSGDHVRLCRCGFSSERPFCDGTHLRIQFQGD